MKLSTKKIIAKEFLIFFGILILSVLLGLCIYPYNAYRHSQIESIRNEISYKTNQSDSLSIKYNTKLKTQENFSKLLISTWSDPEADSLHSDINRLLWKEWGEDYRSDSIPYYYEKKWGPKIVNFLRSKGFADGKEFEKFVGSNLLNKKDSTNYQQSKQLEEIISELEIRISDLRQEINDSYQQIWVIILELIILLTIIAYPIRFFILLIKWSVKTLKQKE
jgi:hypothetical protein